MKNRSFLKYLKKHTLKCAVILSMAVHGAGFYLISYGSFVPNPPVMAAKPTIKINSVFVKVEKPLEKAPDLKVAIDPAKPSLKPESAPPANPVTPEVQTVSPMPLHESSPRTSSIIPKARTPVPDSISDLAPQPVKMVQGKNSRPLWNSASRIPSQHGNPGPRQPVRHIADRQFLRPAFPALQPRQASPVTTVVEMNPAPASKNSAIDSGKEISTVPGLNQAMNHKPHTLTAEETGVPRQPARLLTETAQGRRVFSSEHLYARNPDPVRKVIGKAPAQHKSAGFRETDMHTTRVEERKPVNDDRDFAAPYSPVSPVSRSYLPSLAAVLKPISMTSIAAEFSEVTLNAENRSDSDTRMASTKINENSRELSPEFLGEIKNNFSSQVWNRIAQFKHYPRIARKRGFEGQPVIAFTLANNGELLDIFIEKASAYKMLDQAALQAVQAASPYPSIPKPLNLESIRFKLPVSFILEEP